MDKSEEFVIIRLTFRALWNLWIRKLDSIRLRCLHYYSVYKLSFHRCTYNLNFNCIYHIHWNVDCPWFFIELNLYDFIWCHWDSSIEIVAFIPKFTFVNYFWWWPLTSLKMHNNSLLMPVPAGVYYLQLPIGPGKFCLENAPDPLFSSNNIFIGISSGKIDNFIYQSFMHEYH